MAKTETKKIQIKLVRSLIGCSESQRRIAASLGLRKLNQVVEHDNSAVIMGMVKKIPHLLEVTE